LFWNVAHILRRTVRIHSDVAHHIHPSANIRDSEDFFALFVKQTSNSKFPITIAAYRVFASYAGLSAAGSRRLCEDDLLFISPYFTFRETSDYSPLMVMSALGKLTARFAVIDVFPLK
jgi:hypothetical protein